MGRRRGDWESNLEEEEVAIIEEVAGVLERRQKDKLPAPRDISQRKLLEETVKVNKVLCKFKQTALQRLVNYFM